MKKILYTAIILFVFGQIANAQADLTFVPNSVVASPISQHIGLPITITMSVQNIGTEASGICNTRIFYSTTNNFNDAILFADISLEGLAPGEISSNIQFIRPIPYNFTPGPCYFFIALNHLGVTPESNPFNNREVTNSIIVHQDPWAAQSIPYPIIFIHGLTGNDGTWSDLINDLQNTYGWSNGGNMNFCLNYDANVQTSDTSSGINSDYHDFTNFSSLHKDDFFTVNFDVNYNGIPYVNSIINESNQSGIVKQGLAIRDAIKHVLEITDRDKVILVGHSMGGLAARQYLQNPNIWKDPGVDHHVAKLVTIGTPHGGSNAFDPDIWGLIAPDPSSEAVRDLKTSYLIGNPGVYLFGGVEDLYYMRDYLICCNYYNADVNCNGTEEELITGINEKSISTDLSYSCIIGVGDPLSPNGDGDGIVMAASANINNYLPVNANVFTLGKTTGLNTIWHSELPKQFAGIIQALDEPNDHNNGHAYEVSSGQVNYGIISYQSISSPPKDYDNYSINISSNGTLNIQVYNLPFSQFYINVL
jgi:pimeloyl-ACP methyl ester carboxylesterase